MRPIVEIMTVNFSLLALDQILNNAATLRHMSGGQLAVPLVIRMTTGGGRQLAAQHSHSLEGWYAHIPGLRVLAPATLEDARGMLWPALEDPDPVLIFEHGSLYPLKGVLPDPPPVVDIAHAAVRREGTDVTVVAYGAGVGKALTAADLLAAEGIEAEVIDLRVLRPLDERRAAGLRAPRPTAPWSSTRPGAPAACRPRSAPGSPSRGSSTSTRRWSGSAAPRCPCPTPATSSRRPCRSPTTSWPRPGERSAAMGDFTHALPRGGHGGGHLHRVAGLAR